MRISDWSSDVCSSDLRFAVQKHRRNRHHLAALDLVLEQRAVDRGVADIRIERRHDVERLHDVGAILARQREEGFEGDFAFERAYRVEQFGVRSEEHTSELQSLMRISYAVLCLKKKTP